MKKFTFCLLFLLAVTFVASATPTAPVLTLSSGATTITITDQTPSDLNGVAGAVTYIGPVGAWTVNVSTGEAYPVLHINRLDLNSVDTVTSGPSLPLTITLSIGNLLLTGNQFEMHIGGTLTGVTNANVTYSAQVNGVNAPGAAEGPFVVTDAAPGQHTISFSEDKLASFVLPGSPYSLGQQVVIDLNGAAGTVSFDASLAQIPEPATLLLVGSALLGIGAFSRRRWMKR